VRTFIGWLLFMALVVAMIFVIIELFDVFDDGGDI
jgi:hypothetical protein